MAGERYYSLDLMRGVALFGVLMVNLLSAFRMSLFTHMTATPDFTDMLIAGLLEFKALTLFSFLFGVGTAIQAERAAPRGIQVSRFLVRRFVVLAAVGVAHIVLIWNGDILLLYAVCGLLMVPLLRLPARALAAIGLAALVLPNVPLGVAWPSAEAIRLQAAEATRVYAHGGFVEILEFRFYEEWHFILPLVAVTLQRTFGLMLWGVAAWRSGILREPERYRGLLRGILAGGLLVGGGLTAVKLLAGWQLPFGLEDLASNIALAFGYGAAMLLLRKAHFSALAAAGQMALTNYLVESIVLTWLFYGYGLGLFGKLRPAPAAAIGIALYAAQVILSAAWLRRFRFGPFEWLWRSLTYGRWQEMRR